MKGPALSPQGGRAAAVGSLWARGGRPLLYIGQMGLHLPVLPIFAHFDGIGFIGAAFAAQRMVAVREAAKFVDDVMMFLGKVHERWIAQLRDEAQGFALVFDMLAMFQRKISE